MKLQSRTLGNQLQVIIADAGVLAPFIYKIEGRPIGLSTHLDDRVIFDPGQFSLCQFQVLRVRGNEHCQRQQAG